MTESDVSERPAGRLPARERLLDAADQLFYENGIHTVGIDTIIERAGVAKASLYSTFGSKDELVRAYLESRRDERRQRITGALAGLATPREKLIGLFDVLAASVARPTFRGCAFVNASAESPPGSVVEEVSDAYRAWLKALLVEIAREAGAADPATLATQLTVLYDGAIVTARMDRDPDAARIAKAAATVLVDAALAAA